MSRTPNCLLDFALTSVHWLWRNRYGAALIAGLIAAIILFLTVPAKAQFVPPWHIAAPEVVGAVKAIVGGREAWVVPCGEGFPRWVAGGETYDAWMRPIAGAVLFEIK